MLVDLSKNLRVIGPVVISRSRVTKIVCQFQLLVNKLSRTFRSVILGRSIENSGGNGYFNSEFLHLTKAVDIGVGHWRGRKEEPEGSP